MEKSSVPTTIKQGAVPYFPYGRSEIEKENSTKDIRLTRAKETVSLFVPGRLCLFGEHSDWAAIHRLMNAEIEPGRAIVTGIEEGISSRASVDRRFRVTSSAPQLADFWTDFDVPFKAGPLKEVAQSGAFFAHCAGTASYMLEHYPVGGVHLHLTDMTLPLKKGLSSSAAICVTVVRAFNSLYRLGLTTSDEMEAAFRGEERTRSRCGRLDQACAFGIRPVLMDFDGNDVAAEPIPIGGEIRLVFADLCAGKNTVKILSDLSRAYPFGASAADRALRRALGADNLEITARAVEYLRAGDARRLGALMTRAQKIFDRKVAPHSPDELRSPRLHAVLADPVVRRLAWGGKGVGSHGDGAVQFVARSADSQLRLKRRLLELGTRPYELTLSPSRTDGAANVRTGKFVETTRPDLAAPKARTVRKAVIPVAGLASRLYPASRAVRKEFFPVVDRDGLAKPAVLILLEELVESGIDEICLVLAREEDRAAYDRLLAPPEPFLRKKLSDAAAGEAAKIKKIARRVAFAYQPDPRGFGDAVFRTRAFAGGEPVLLMLGDTLYRSAVGTPCAAQLADAYRAAEKPIVAVQAAPPEKGELCGMVRGAWLDSAERLMAGDAVAEKPGAAEARRAMTVRRRDGSRSCYALFGQYILTPALYAELEKAIAAEKRGEVDLTGALDALARRGELLGFVPEGESFDLGTPELYRRSIGRWPE